MGRNRKHMLNVCEATPTFIDLYSAPQQWYCQSLGRLHPWVKSVDFLNIMRVPGSPTESIIS